MSAVYQSQNNDMIFATQVKINAPKTSRMNNRGSYNLRVKQLKNHIRELEGYHNRALSDLTKTKKSLGQISRNTQKVKVNFLKLYQNKKIKLMSRQNMQNKKIQDTQRMKSIINKTRERRLTDQLQLQATRNQENQKNEVRRQLFTRQKQRIRKEVKLNRLQDELYAKQKHKLMKDHRSQVLLRNRKIQEIIFMKGKLNYAEQAEKQLEQIKAYEQIIAQLEDLEQKQQQYRPKTTTSKSFFITTKRMQNNYFDENIQTKPGSTRATRRKIDIKKL